MPDPIRDEVGEYKFKIKRTGEGWSDITELRITVTAPGIKIVIPVPWIKDNKIIVDVDVAPTRPS
jgi:hypothetical protein